MDFVFPLFHTSENETEDIWTNLSMFINKPAVWEVCLDVLRLPTGINLAGFQTTSPRTSAWNNKKNPHNLSWGGNFFQCCALAMKRIQNLTSFWRSSQNYFVLVLFCFQLRFQVQKLGVNFATKFASTFQCLNYCKQISVVQVEINNSMESCWSSGLPRSLYFVELVIIMEYEHLFTNEVQTLKWTCEPCCEVRAQFPNLEM
jgi:hypothetical protein